MEKSDKSGSVSNEIEPEAHKAGSAKREGLTPILPVNATQPGKAVYMTIEDLMPFSPSTHASQPGECCIYKVHKRLRDKNPAAYTPKMVSIGPLHRGNKELASMEKYKIIYLADFCRRTGKTRTQLAVRVGNQMEKIRACYESEAFDNIFRPRAPVPTDDEILNMFLLDSIFIIELFLKIDRDETDFIIGKPCFLYTICLDLIMLENQLPYFVLNDLCSFACGNHVSFYMLTCRSLVDFINPPSVENKNIPKRICSYFCLSCFCKKHKEQPPQEQVLQVSVKKFEGEKHKHVTDLVRRFQSYNQPTPENVKSVRLLYSATKLHEAGVKFEVPPNAWPLNIKFERGTLTMPRFRFEHDTECVIRNLMAFEQSHYPDEAYICNYIDLLDSLIDTENDVDLLVQMGIIYHGLGQSQAVAKLLNNLCLEITYTQKCYSDIASALNAHYESCWHKTTAKLRHVYFSDLWKGTATVAAIVLLILTFIQTILSFIQSI